VKDLPLVEPDEYVRFGLEPEDREEEPEE
jgi:hypothetical protein